MNPDLNNLLKRTANVGGLEPTHVNYAARERLSVTSNMWTNFWKGLCDITITTNKPLTLAELPPNSKYVPVIVNGILKFANVGELTDIPLSFFHKIIHYFQIVFNQTLESKVSGENTAVLLGPDSGRVDPNTNILEIGLN